MVRESRGELRTVVFDGRKLLVFATVLEGNRELLRRIRVVKRRREDMETKKVSYVASSTRLSNIPTMMIVSSPEGQRITGTGSCPSMTDDGPVKHSPVF
jgi:hypothetical protein